MNRIARIFKTKILICIVLQFAAISFASAQVAPLVTAENLDTGEVSQLVLTKSTREELEEMSPKNLRSSEKLKQLIEKFRSVSKDAAVGSGKTLLNIQGDFLLFSAASGAVSVRKLLTDADSNPNALKDFWYRQIKNPFAWVSFYSFYVANRGTSALYEALVTKFGWMRDEKLFAQYMDMIADAHFNKSVNALLAAGEQSNLELIYQKAQQLLPKPIANDFFAEMKAPFALGMGVFFVNLTFDFITDPDVQACAAYSGKDNVVDFCDIAYQNWVVKGKIFDQAPYFAGSFLTAILQAFVMNRGGPTAKIILNKFVPVKFANRFKSYEFKGLELGLTKTKNFIRLKPVAFVLGAYSFIEVLPYVTAPIDSLYQKNKLGSEIALHQNNINLFFQTAQKDAVDINALMLEIQNLSVANLNWRQHWTAPVGTKISAWMDYISSLESDYFSSKLFYNEMIKRFSVPSAITQTFFQASPYYGLDPNYSITEISQKIARALQFSKSKRDELTKLGARASVEQTETILLLKSIESSLLAISPTAPQNKVLRERVSKIEMNPDLSAYQKLSMISDARDEEFTVGIKTLQNLALNPRLAPFGFAEMNKILAGARPMAKGEFEIYRMNNDPHLITQPNESRFPTKVGDIEVRSESEYLLAEFACNEDKLIKEFWGIGLRFHPPKMIQESSVNYCNLSHEKLDPVDTKATDFNVNYLEKDGTSLHGLLEVIRKNLRPELKGQDGLDHFQTYWTNSVDPILRQKLKEKDIEFSRMLNDNLKPLLEDSSDYVSSSVTIPNGIYRSLEQEYRFYLHTMQAALQMYGLKGDLTLLENTFELQVQLLDQKKSAVELRSVLTAPENADLNTRLTAALAGLKNSDLKKIKQAHILALSRSFDVREDIAFGTIIEISKSHPELVSGLLLMKTKMIDLKDQWKNLLTLEESMDIHGL